MHSTSLYFSCLELSVLCCVCVLCVCVCVCVGPEVAFLYSCVKYLLKAPKAACMGTLLWVAVWVGVGGALSQHDPVGGFGVGGCTVCAHLGLGWQLVEALGSTAHTVVAVSEQPPQRHVVGVAPEQKCELHAKVSKRYTLGGVEHKNHIFTPGTYFLVVLEHKNHF